MKVKKILIIADDSAPSINAVRYGFSFAKDVGAKVMLLNVIDAESAAGNPDAGIFPDDALGAVKSRADDFLHQVKKTYAQAVETELLAAEGDIQPTIIKIIVDWNADLVIAGTHRRTGLSKWLHGSIAESIVRYSPVPVCVVPFVK